MAWFANGDRDLLSAFQSRVICDVEVERRDSLTLGLGRAAARAPQIISGNPERRNCQGLGC
jgi:hypothetical protein